MRLKIVTTVLLVLGIGLLMGYPWLLRSQPERSDRPAVRQFVVRFALYSSATLVVFFSTAVCAWILVRRTREEFRQASKQNLQHLVEGAIQDHRAKRENESEPS